MTINIICLKTMSTDLAFLGSGASSHPLTQTYPKRKRAEEQESLLGEISKPGVAKPTATNNSNPRSIRTLISLHFMMIKFSRCVPITRMRIADKGNGIGTTTSIAAYSDTHSLRRKVRRAYIEVEARLQVYCARWYTCQTANQRSDITHLCIQTTK